MFNKNPQILRNKFISEFSMKGDWKVLNRTDIKCHLIKNVRNWFFYLLSYEKKYEKQSIFIFVLFFYVVVIWWTLKWVQSELHGYLITLFVSNALREHKNYMYLNKYSTVKKHINLMTSIKENNTLKFQSIVLKYFFYTITGCPKVLW